MCSKSEVDRLNSLGENVWKPYAWTDEHTGNGHMDTQTDTHSVAISTHALTHRKPRQKGTVLPVSWVGNKTGYKQLIHSPVKYRIVLNKRSGRGGMKRTQGLVRSQWNWLPKPLNALGICPENLIEIGQVVPEIWLVKVKSQGRVYSSRHVYSIQYGM